MLVYIYTHMGLNINPGTPYHISQNLTKQTIPEQEAFFSNHHFKQLSFGKKKKKKRELPIGYLAPNFTLQITSDIILLSFLIIMKRLLLEIGALCEVETVQWNAGDGAAVSSPAPAGIHLSTDL